MAQHEGEGGYRLFVSDVDAGQVAFIGTLDEENADPAKGTPALIALRLRIAGNQITEIEQEVVRNMDAANRVAALGSPHRLFTQPIPANQRMSRADLIRTANIYFTGMQQNDGKGDYPFAADCNRIENGMQTTNRPTPRVRHGPIRPRPRTTPPSGAASSSSNRGCCISSRVFAIGATWPSIKSGVSCSASCSSIIRGRDAQLHGAERTQGHGRARAAMDLVHRRDVRVEDGKLRQIEAVLDRVPYGMNSGWSSWEDGMSDRAQDVTRAATR